MSVDRVRKHLKEHGHDGTILFFDDTSTVDKAAQALGTTPGEIAKTLAVWTKDSPVLVVTAGDRRLDNRKFREAFGAKPRFLGPEEVQEATGHPVGGVCPFGVPGSLEVFLDESLKEYEVVYPAAGQANAAVKIRVEDLPRLTGGSWVDVCR